MNFVGMLIFIFPFLLCGDVKEEIEILKNRTQTEELIKLAKVHLRDQDVVKAFQVFLKVLEHSSPKRVGYVMSEKESELYEKAIQIYLNQNEGVSPFQIGLQLRNEFSSVVSEHPDYYQLNYVVAAAFANNALFEEFFDSFYRSYQAIPDHYLAFKSKAQLHLKLYERIRDAEEKENHRKQLIENLKQALEKNNHDIVLYKFLMIFASDREKADVIESGLNKIVDDNMIVPRTDVAFFVQEAVKVKKYEAAQRFINKAKEWYSFSRAIDAAQKTLDQKQ